MQYLQLNHNLSFFHITHLIVVYEPRAHFKYKIKGDTIALYHVLQKQLLNKETFTQRFKQILSCENYLKLKSTTFVSSFSLFLKEHQRKVTVICLMFCFKKTSSLTFVSVLCFCCVAIHIVIATEYTISVIRLGQVETMYVSVKILLRYIREVYRMLETLDSSMEVIMRINFSEFLNRISGIKDLSRVIS